MSWSRFRARCLAPDIDIDTRGNLLHLTVTDDGTGFPASPDRSGIGMTAMRERLHLVKGELTVGAAPGGGALVTAVVPLA